MNSQITGLRVASVVFGLITIPQLVRLVVRPEVLVAGHANTIVAKCARHYHFWWSEYSDVESRSHLHQSEQLSRHA